MNITDSFLNDGEFIKVAANKKSIVLHHTASSYNPLGVISWWNKDPDKVGTAYVIGGSDDTIKGTDKQFNGHVYRAFDDVYWAYHLGLSNVNAYQNNQVNAQAVAIEVCNWGFIRSDASGKLWNYASQQMKPESVAKIKPFRGNEYYHKYTSEQIASLKQLIIDCANKYSIDVKRKGGYGLDWFNLSQEAINGKEGLWNHCNFRIDKTDVWPQIELIDMLNSL